jgi:glycosyltransferase involved in cell wall biosynthesis
MSINILPNGLLKAIDSHRPDIVHLHWVGAGMLRIEDMPALCSKYPVVWTLHDMWPFCGAEHCAYSEDRWRDGYERANRSPLARGIDLNRWVWRRKLKSWTGCTIHTISVSTWMNDCVGNSKLFEHIRGERTVIPNGIDTSVFANADATAAGKVKPTGAKRPYRILFGANSQTNRIKGGDLLMAALRILQERGIDFELHTFGGGFLTGDQKLAINHYGKILDESRLARIYSDADLMVVPSRLESFGLTAAESMACGTPVVCFDTSGLRDIVVHKVNGYRARRYDPNDLAKGIMWCLDHEPRLNHLSTNARDHAATCFSSELVLRQTLAFYNAVLRTRRQHTSLHAV